MRVKHLALAVILGASMLLLATPVMAIELGALQAVPSNYPPYVFRLTIVSSPRGSSDLPAVTVLQPRDSLSLVKHNLLELRLPSLTDVELEVNQGGQTFNRLLLRSELQAARARLETTAPRRHQTTKTKGRQSPAAEDGALPPATAEPADRALLAREMHAIRQEIQNLVGRVTPWEGLSPPAWPAGAHAAAPLVTLTLWGVFIAGMASLCTGYLMQRRAVARQRRRLLAASTGRPRGELMSGGAIRHPVQRAQLSEGQPGALKPVAVRRRVRVSQKTWRRIRLRPPHDTHDVTGEWAAPHTPVVARISHTQPSGPAEVVEALGHLRRELIRLQRRLPNVNSLERPEDGPTQAAR
jgi:hypothetical protein